MKHKNFQHSLYTAFRVLVGLFFLSHGAQKLFGMFGGTPVTLVSKFGLAGLIEFIGGLFILLGLFTSVVAVIAALEMLVAYFTVHVPTGGILPLMQQANGEAPALFFAAFLVLIAFGAGKWSLEYWILWRLGHMV